MEVDVRVVAATNRNLHEAIEEGRLRKDLFYRLNVFTIFLPPLRERLEDLQNLTDHFIKMFNARYKKSVGGFSAESWGLMRGYAWPGNVRELRNVIERAVILCSGAEAGPEHLPEELTRPPGDAGNDESSARMVSVPLGPLSRVEERLIARALDETKGKKPEAARILGISLKTFYNKLKKMKEDPEKDA